MAWGKKQDHDDRQERPRSPETSSGERDVDADQKGAQGRTEQDRAPALPLEEVDQARLDALVAERDRLADDVARYQRALADAENRARTARKDVEEARKQGVTSVTLDVVTALDHFDLALSHDLASAKVEQVLAGVEQIKGELLRALARHGVGVIEPASGEELDPLRHQAMMRQPAQGVDPGRVVQTMQVGYTLGDRVVRPAKVIVADERPAGEPAPAAEANPESAADEQQQQEQEQPQRRPGGAGEQGASDADV